MKYVLVLFICFVCSSLYGQSAAFTEIENKINTFIGKGQWDEVLMLAPDLIIEESGKGEGFYYTALAFFNLSALDKSDQYLKRAEALADKPLADKINRLKKDIALTRKMQTTLTETEQVAVAGNSEKTATAWMELWAMDKKQIEFALNAVEIYIKEKKYPQALEILTNKEISSEPEAKALADLINNTPEMRALNGYVKSMENGRQYYKNENYEGALSQFENALTYKPGDDSALDMKNKSIDEVAWQKATNSNTIYAYEEYINKSMVFKVHKQEAMVAIDEIAWSNAKSQNTINAYQRYIDGKTLNVHKNEATRAIDEIAWSNARSTNSIQSYEAYVNGSTIKSHRSEAISILKNSLIHFGELNAEKNDIQQMEYYLNKYLNDYPNGEDADKARQIMCRTYFQNGINKSQQKNESAQASAIAFYNKTEQVCPGLYAVAKPIKKAQRLEKSYGRNDRTFVSYLYDEALPIGASAGVLMNRNTGVYVAFRSEKNYFFDDSAFFTVDNSGAISYPNNIDARYISNDKIGTAEYTIGITQYVAFPFWIYLGAGVQHSKTWWEMDEYFLSTGNYYKTEWVRNTDLTTFKVVGDLGIIMDVGGFNLRAGLTTVALETWSPHFGIGFSF